MRQVDEMQDRLRMAKVRRSAEKNLGRGALFFPPRWWFQIQIYLFQC